jgi:hypothetical protein
MTSSSISTPGDEVQALKGPVTHTHPDCRPDCRRFLCDRCGEPRTICSVCDRGHRYCGEDCRRQARKRSTREAGRRYQRTRRGRRNHARRQAEYMHRREKMTHQGCPPREEPAKVIACSTKPPPPPLSCPPSPSAESGPTYLLLCFLCRAWCEPLVRHDFLRRRRREEVTRDSRDTDMDAGRDPPPVHQRGLA